MGAVTLAKASFMALDRIERARPRSRSGAPNPTRAHVHPNSRRAGTFEEDFFYSYAKGEPDRLYKQAAELLKRKNAVRRVARAEGRPLTEDERLATLITNTALRVFEQLTTLARTCAGKVFPTWEWIEAAAGVSRASVHRALTALAAMGLLDKQRRCVPIDPPADRPKARNAQTSNVYRMRFPNRLVRFLPRFLRPVPLPDDVVQREADRIEGIEAMRLWRSPRQVVAEEIEDEGLRQVLDSLAIAVEKQESQNSGQPLLDSYVLGSDGVGLAGQRFAARRRRQPSSQPNDPAPTVTPNQNVGRDATRRDAPEGSKRLPLRSNGELRAWCSRFSSFIAAVAPVASVGLRDRQRRPLIPAAFNPYFPAAVASWSTIIMRRRDHNPAGEIPARVVRPGPFTRLFLNRWENGRWSPSTIKQITGCAYGFRYADPPFFCLIAATALPFNSHQE